MALRTVSPARNDTEAQSAYATLRARHLGDMRARIPAALDRLYWPSERLHAQREAALRNLVRIAKAGSRWQRARLRHVDPETLTERSLQDVAPMTKDEVMDNFDAISTDPRITLATVEAHLQSLRSDAYLFDRFHVNASGGSSGRRGIVVFDWDAWAEYFLGFFRQLIRLRLRNGTAADRPMVGAIVAAQDPTHSSGSLPVTFSDPASAFWHRYPVTLPLDEIIAGLNAVQPELLGGYPSLVHQLAICAQGGALSIAPKIVFCSSEPLLPEIRAAIHSAWGVTPLNMWAATEGGALASSCGEGPGLHLSDDTVIVEPVDERGAPVAAGVRSAKVLVTPLFNPTPLPLLRYEITDEITLLDECCPCGSAHRLIADIEGRMDDTFDYGTARVHPHIFRSRLAQERGIVEYQIRQTATGAQIDIRRDGRVDMEALRAGLVGDLRRAGLSTPDVVIAAVSSIPRPASGKLKRFIALPAGSTAQSPT